MHKVNLTKFNFLGITLTSKFFCSSKSTFIKLISFLIYVNLESSSKISWQLKSLIRPVFEAKSYDFWNFKLKTCIFKKFGQNCIDKT